MRNRKNDIEGRCQYLNVKKESEREMTENKLK